MSHVLTAFDPSARSAGTSPYEWGGALMNGEAS